MSNNNESDEESIILESELESEEDCDIPDPGFFEEEHEYMERMGEPIYDCRKYIEFDIAGGGSGWYKYQIMFNESNKQTKTYGVTCHGKQAVHDGKRAIIKHVAQEYDQRIKFVDNNYECDDDEFELEWLEK
jgi:hypothetical protein